jgi:putative peptide zinc metalloprotease protein
MVPRLDVCEGSSARRLPWRMRPDLEVHRVRLLQREQIVLKDPVGLNYYRFEPEEFALLEMLDGQASLEQIQQRFEERFAPQTIRLAELQRLIGRLHHDSLLLADLPGQGARLRDRHAQRAWEQLRGRLANPLCLRFRGLDPDRWLAWLSRFCGWCFAPAAWLAGLILVLSALLLVFVQGDTLRSRLPALQDLAGPEHWLILAAIVGLTRLMHELGHGLACHRYGGRCTELGVMWLVVVPSLYCNVSDAWILPNKWQRLAIGAAGVYVELTLASLGTWLWWYTQPGWLNQVCLQVLCVCSISAVAFNANPLLRYDGYYALADWLEIPNLRQRASAALRGVISTLFLRGAAPPDTSVSRRQMVFLIGYAAGAASYRWCVLAAVLWLLARVLEPYRLQLISQALTAAACYGLVVLPLWNVIRTCVGVPGTLDRVRRRRVAWTLAAAGLAAAVFLVPLPHYVTCQAVVQPRQAASVYVDVPGWLVEIGVRPGQQVCAGQPLARLENLDVRLAVEQLECLSNQWRARLSGLRQRALRGETAATAEIEPAAQTLAAVEERWHKRRGDLERLVLAAPRDGVVVSPPQRTAEQARLGWLPAWSGLPLEDQHVGALLAAGTLVCQIGDPRECEALLWLEPSQLEFVRPGQSVRLLLAQCPGEPFDATLAEISQSQGPPLAEATGLDRQRLSPSTGAPEPVSRDAPSQARCSFEVPGWLAVSGAQARARIFTGYRTLGQRLVRWTAQTFRS